MPTTVGTPIGTVGWDRLRRRLLTWELTALRVTLLYLCVGFAALYASDVVLVQTLDEPLLARVQAVKGAVEVVLTGGLLFVLTRRSRSQLRRKNESLGRQREELDVLHRVLRHNLRNALTVITGRVQKLRDDGDLDAEDLFHCNRIQATARDVVALVEQASRIRRVTDGARLVTVDLTGTVESVLEAHPAVPADVDLRTDLPESVPVTVNHLFEEALAELVENAVAHNDADRSRLAIAVDPDAGNPNVVEVTVADDGPGVDEHVRAVFERGELDQLLHLDGMGLWFVYWTITDGGGDFAIEDNEWGGTTVRLRVPVPGAEPIDAPARATAIAV